MAHHYRVVVEPHKNKDGSDSKVRKDHKVLHRGRGGSYEVGVVSSIAAVEKLIESERVRLRSEHADRNPNDQAFRRKGVSDEPLTKQT
jgi:hypothetical protein